MRKKIKRIIGGFALAVTAAAVIAGGLAALEVPQLKQRVNDYANILSPQTVNALESKLEQLESSDSTQIVVLTVPSLEGDSLEDFSMRTAEKWKIGQKKLDNGVILLISKSDRAVRIEVGYGLEGKLTDLVSGRIIDGMVIPNFKNGNFDAGVEEAVDAIIAVVRGEFQSKDSPAKDRPSASSGKSVFFILFLFFILGSVGQVKKIFSGILGAVLLPIVAFFMLSMGIWVLFLIPVGFVLGLILPFFIGSGGGRHGGGYYRGSGGGGFSGGGGSFGGGGASGRW